MELLHDGPREAPLVLLAHGAGAPMDSPWMNAIAEEIASHGIGVVRFEFPYMERRRRTGRRGAPDRAPVLEATWADAVAAVGDAARLVIGGKSMGGRFATRVADRLGVAGVVALGYPFHPPGRPERTRIAHLGTLRTRTLILQGTRDPFGGPEEVATYALADAVEVVWLEDGDHGWKPRKRSGFTLEAHLKYAGERIGAFVREAAGD